MQKFMNKGSTKKFFSTLAILSLVMPGVLLQAPLQQEARAVGVAAGTVIGNQATAKYKDINNNSYNSTSNLVTTTVATIYGVTLTPNGTVAVPGQSQSATPGTTVYYPYTLTNTGNGPDTYAMTSPVDGTSTFAPASKKVYFDANGNGVVDVGDTLIADGGATVSVPADTSIKLIVEYQVPSTGVTSGQFAAVDLIANSVGDLGATLGTIVDNTNYNKTTIVNDAVVTVTKSVDKATVNPSTLVPAVNNELIYTLDVGNTGNQPADDIIIVDEIPANTQFKVGSATAPTGVQITYSDQPTGTVFTYSPTGTYDPNVKRVRYIMNAANGGVLAPANNRALTFAVKVNENAPSVNIPNFANSQYKQNSGTVVGDDNSDGIPEIPTNTVTTLVNKKSATEISFSGAPFTGTTTAGTQDPAFPNVGSDKTIINSTPAGTYIYYKNVITNNGNATDTFNVALDATQSKLPSGAIVSFFILTDNGTGANNTSPLLDTNSDSIPDTAAVPGIAPTAGSATAGTKASYSIVTRVFIPAAASNLNNATTAASSIGDSTVTVTTGSLFTAGDRVTIGGNVYSVSSVSGNVLTLSTTLSTAVASGDLVTRSVVAVIKATSTNGGTAIGTAPTLNLSDTTADFLTSITAPSVNLSNIFNNTTNDETTRSLTQSASGATVSYPLNINNTGSGSDTFSLMASIPNPVGSTVAFFPLIPASTTTLAAATTETDTSVTLTSGAGFAPGDSIIINGKTLTVGSVTGNVVTFASGQTIGSVVASGSSVVERGNTAITDTGVIAAGASQQIVAVVTALSTTPGTYPITFTSTSTNNTGVLDTITDNLVIPNFRTFTLQADRTGSIPPGGTLFYSHTLTNTGNIAEAFNLTLPLLSNGLSYQIIDATGAVVTTSSGGNSTFTTPSVPVGGTYVFQVKVSAPSNAPINTVSSVVLSAQETTSLQTITNTDVTTVVEGFISLTKSVAIYSFGTNGLDGTVQAGPGVKPGEVLEYTINYQNIGSQTAREVSINDLIPANTTYVAGSLVINSVSKTDATGPEVDPTTGSAQYNTTTGTTYFVGATATDTLGGNVVQGGSGNVKFRVRVNP